MELFGAEKNAIFSEDRKYRYALWRIWDADKPKVMFIGLNPSTANENENDPTIRRVAGFAKDWGYGGVYMMNLFPLVSTKPEALNVFYDSKDHFIEDVRNLCSLMETERKCQSVVFAWGNFKVAERRARLMCSQFINATCLGINKNGTPKHPLYIKAITKQIPFNNQTT